MFRFPSRAEGNSIEESANRMPIPFSLELSGLTFSNFLWNRELDRFNHLSVFLGVPRKVATFSNTLCHPGTVAASTVFSMPWNLRNRYDPPGLFVFSLL